MPRCRPINGIERLFDERCQRAAIPLAHRIEPQRADGQRNPVERFTAGDADELEAAATKIADHAIGIGNPRNHAQGGAACLHSARNGFDAQPGFTAHPVDEIGGIAGLTHRSSRDDPQAGHLHGVGERAKPRQRSDGGVHGVLAELAIGGEPPPQPGHHLFIEQRRRNAGQPLIDDETHRIGPNVDNGDKIIGDRRCIML